MKGLFPMVCAGVGKSRDGEAPGLATLKAITTSKQEGTKDRTGVTIVH